MNFIKHRINQIKFYIKKYGFIKTIKKCIKVVIRKIIRIIKNEKDLQYGDYGGWIRYNELKDADLKEQAKREFKIMPKISLIVPMYKTKEKFLKELVECLVRQSYPNWELCLADGSDKENPVYKKYVESDERIKYKFLNKNLGISGNSNEALKMATGDYIALLDHDDLLVPEALYETTFPRAAAHPWPAAGSGGAVGAGVPGDAHLGTGHRILHRNCRYYRHQPSKGHRPL